MPAPSAPPNNKATPQGNKVRVVARIRPLAKYEVAKGCESVVDSIPPPPEADTQQLHVHHANDSRWFELDAVFDHTSTQADVYTACGAQEAVARELFQGYHCTILAYGQTGAGKTFSMGTAAVEGGTELSETSGIIPRACHDLFAQIEEQCQGQATVELQYMEVYNEEIRDLLLAGPKGGKNSSSSSMAQKPPQLRIRETPQGEVYVRGLSSVKVASPSDIGRYMAEASGRRMVAATKMNATSSRSHAIAVLRIQGTTIRGNTKTKFQAKLTLVDLAGSERIKKTGAAGHRAAEGISINKGLFVLGQVVSALSDASLRKNGNTKKHTPKPPYRDSKLTRLLQDSLGGNARTILVACVSPADFNVEETVNTLRYATSARNITNTASSSAVQQAAAVPAHQHAAVVRENQLLQAQVQELEKTIAQLTQNVKALEEEARSVDGLPTRIAADGKSTDSGSTDEDDDDVSALDNSTHHSRRGGRRPNNTAAAVDKKLADTDDSSPSDPDDDDMATDAKEVVETNVEQILEAPPMEEMTPTTATPAAVVDPQDDSHSQGSLSVSGLGTVTTPKANNQQAPVKKTYEELENEVAALRQAVKRGQADMRAMAAQSGVALPKLKKKVAQLQDELQDSVLLEQESFELRRELEQTRAEAAAAKKAADHLSQFMEAQLSQSYQELNVPSGTEVDDKRNEYQNLVANEEWIQLTVNVIASFQEQMRLLGDFFHLVVRIVDEPEVVASLMPKKNPERARPKRFSLDFWRSNSNQSDDSGNSENARLSGGDRNLQAKMDVLDHKKAEMDLRQKLLSEHIQFFNEKFLEIEDVITQRSEKVQEIQDTVHSLKEHVEEEMGTTEFMRNMLFAGRSDEILLQLQAVLIEQDEDKNHRGHSFDDNDSDVDDPWQNLSTIFDSDAAIDIEDYEYG